MDTISDVWTLKLMAFAIIWMAACPFYYTYKDYDVNVKTVTVMMFPLIMFLVWFFVFWWG
jgi:hypothetical protein